LRKVLLEQREMFVQTFAEKLLTYAMGRSLAADDMPAVREIVRRAARDDYRLSALVLGVAASVPMQMRSSAATQGAVADAGRDARGRATQGAVADAGGDAAE
jgi:hypothetical protein